MGVGMGELGVGGRMYRLVCPAESFAWKQDVVNGEFGETQ